MKKLQCILVFLTPIVARDHLTLEVPLVYEVDFELNKNAHTLGVTPKFGISSED